VDHDLANNLMAGRPVMLAAQRTERRLRLLLAKTKSCYVALEDARAGAIE
jgi:hypothetical protein